MTAQQQQLTKRISTLSDEGIELVNQIINGLNPSFFVTTDEMSMVGQTKKTDVSRRIGIVRGRLGDTSNFGKWDEEIASFFEGTVLRQRCRAAQS